MTSTGATNNVFGLFKQTIAKARFEISELAQFGKGELQELTIINPGVVVSKKVTEFCKAKKIEVANAAEVALILEYKQKLATQAIMSVSDVHGYYLNKQDSYYSEQGLVLVEKEGDNTTLKAQPWIAPAELIKAYPGIQWIVGMTIACVKRTEHGLEEQRETKLYEMSGFTGLNYTQMSTFAKFVIALIGRDFDATPNTGNGREFINELFAAIGRLSTVEYLMLHRSLVIGPFSECFEWSEVKGDGTLKKM